MFGKTIDYRLLRLFTHGRHPEAEELRQVLRNLGVESAKARFDKWNRRLGNEIPWIRRCTTWMSGAEWERCAWRWRGAVQTGDGY